MSADYTVILNFSIEIGYINELSKRYYNMNEVIH